MNVRAHDGATALMLTAGAGDIDTVRAFLTREADVNGKFVSTGKTAAMLAADRGYDEIAQLIREKDETDALRSNTEPLAQVWTESEFVGIENQISKKASDRLSNTEAAIWGRREASTIRDNSKADALIYSE